MVSDIKENTTFRIRCHSVFTNSSRKQKRYCYITYCYLILYRIPIEKVQPNIGGGVCFLVWVLYIWTNLDSWGFVVWDCGETMGSTKDKEAAPELLCVFLVVFVSISIEETCDLLCYVPRGQIKATFSRDRHFTSIDLIPLGKRIFWKFKFAWFCNELPHEMCLFTFSLLVHSQFSQVWIFKNSNVTVGMSRLLKVKIAESRGSLFGSLFGLCPSRWHYAIRYFTSSFIK